MQYAIYIVSSYHTINQNVIVTTVANTGENIILKHDIRYHYLVILMMVGEKLIAASNININIIEMVDYLFLTTHDRLGLLHIIDPRTIVL
jgi:hypothetical protein